MKRYIGLFALLYLVVGSLLWLVFEMNDWQQPMLQLLITLFVAANLTGIRFVKDNGRTFEKPERLKICIGSMLVFWLFAILGSVAVLAYIPEGAAAVLLINLQQQPIGFFIALAIFGSGISYLIFFLAYGPIVSQYAAGRAKQMQTDESDKE